MRAKLDSPIALLPFTCDLDHRGHIIRKKDLSFLSDYVKQLPRHRHSLRVSRSIKLPAHRYFRPRVVLTPFV